MPLETFFLPSAWLCFQLRNLWWGKVWLALQDFCTFIPHPPLTRKPLVLQGWAWGLELTEEVFLDWERLEPSIDTLWVSQMSQADSLSGRALLWTPQRFTPRICSCLSGTGDACSCWPRRTYLIAPDLQCLPFTWGHLTSLWWASVKMIPESPL